MVGKLTKVPLRGIWEHEAKDFSSWLADNIEVLSEKLDFSLSVVEKNKTVGSFFIDILAEDEQGRPVIIENQLEQTNHDHLGKIVTYISSMDAKTGIWITSRPRAEHKKAIEWLNEATPADVRFYLVKMEAVRIGKSEPAPLFTIVAKPEEEAKLRGEEKKKLARRHVLRKKFWTQLLAKAKRKTDLHSNISPGIWNWIGTGAGKSGLSFIYAISKKEGWTEFYIDRGKGNQKQNKKWFDIFFRNKKRIEKTFGDTLDWERLDDKRASRIAKRYKGVGLYDEEKWDRLQSRMIDGMIRLERALRDHIKEL